MESYNWIVARWVFGIAALMALTAAFAAVRAQPPPAADLKEEDTGVTVEKEYVFNPLQAEKELKVGDYYTKKGSHKAAAGRYLEAVKWNPGLTEAWRKLALARERIKDDKAAAEAWKKYLELAPDAKDAKQIRKKLDAQPG
jgi:tetratricopeptide (TPR) repeat protein